MSNCCIDKSCDEHTCMLLPEDATCLDCVHFSRCEYLISCKAIWPDSTECDWFPRRYASRNTKNPYKIEIEDGPVNGTVADLRREAGRQ